MKTPNVNPLGLPVRCKFWDERQAAVRQKDHWSYIRAHVVRKKRRTAKKRDVWAEV